MDNRIRFSDSYAEDTLLGLLLTGDAEVYRYSADLQARDFENLLYRVIYTALECFYDAGEIEVVEIYKRLDRRNLIDPSPNGLPIAFFANLCAQAVERTNQAIDKLADHRVPLTLGDAVAGLVARVKVARANREDEYTGGHALLEILTLSDFDRLTPAEVVERLMEAQGPGAEYLGRFKEGARSWVVSVLLEKAEERVLVEA